MAGGPEVGTRAATGVGAPGVGEIRVPPDLARACRRLWFSFWFLIAGVSIGLAWDRGWHATHAFDTFYSPPHLFTYSMTILDMLLVLAITCSARLRPWFGAGVRVPLAQFAVPASLALLLGGFVTLGCAGVLDDLWHTAFGLDETGWSTPHSMIGWGLLIIFLGYLACFIALRPERRLPWYSALALGYFALTFSLTPFLGPLHDNRSPDALRAIATIPVLLAQPAAQHTFRIYLTWNITHYSPLYLPLSALWAGAALAFIRALDPRARTFLTLAGIWTLLTLAGDRSSARNLDAFISAHTRLVTHLAQRPAEWLPLPLIVPAVIVALLLALRAPRWLAWGVAGLSFGALVYAIWPPSPGIPPLILLAAPLMWLGARLGERVCAVVRAPAGVTIRWLLLASAVVPLVTGATDLFLRTNTP